MTKYLNKPQKTEDGYFASKKELARWQDLKLLEKAGKITDLKRQVNFPLIVNGFLICRYRADAVYKENGKRVVEDCKGRRSGLPYQMFKLKAGLMKATLGIDVAEV
jgi:hypothetical protein